MRGSYPGQTRNRIKRKSVIRFLGHKRHFMLEEDWEEIKLNGTEGQTSERQL